ncbi:MULTISPECIES: DMT family transporter [unclassified Undibacterium]|uniref:DMT family transporter n=1 Tax=unclassified Undibacterium TaxID=2630295 RepID=UPI002AC9D2D1|nr:MULTISPECIES: DMT family transporter [unclassified Undibacterium]MEB0141096.1 DMT family transporter [Undibacterium sp. CCC2.1]MEB0174125.1 DMT family transporter [Undibacterium sp. CCC1.1]MEB0177824.1 DMT family transporter [Undibacterium sp. CCC3.4]MEB0217039.1 DMT family transporter [Undibacterium sp. 5I2]WPX41999.1 DMT family transporter [Undibacterium sp. CCC3.4]
MLTLTSSSSERRHYLGGLLIAVLGAVLFSTKAIVAKLIYRYHVDAVTLIGFRMAFSLPVFAAVAVWQMRAAAPLSAGERWRLLVLGLIGYYLSSFLDFLGLQYISAGLERLILFLTPSFVMLMSVLLFRRKVTALEWGALLLSYLGIILVFLHDLRFGGQDVLLGSALVLGAAISYAAYLLQSGQLVNKLGSLRLVAYAMCVSSAACIGQFFLLRPAALLIQPVPVYYLSVVNAIFCTVLPVFMTMIAVQRIGAATASQAGMIGPVSTLFLGAVFLAEPITAWQLAGTSLVMAGMYLLSKKKSA